MTNVAALYDTENKKGLFGQARILSADREKRTAKIYVDSLSGIQEIFAVIAIPYDLDFVRDDIVLIAGDDINSIYIIGVLSAKSPVRIDSKNGTYAILTEAETTSSFQLFSDSNELILEYDTENKKTKINSGNSNLEVLAPAGDIAFRSANSISFSGETITLHGRKSLHALVQDEHSTSESSLSIGTHQTKVHCPELRVTATKGNLFLEELIITGKNFLSTMARATMQVDTLETRALSIITKARNIYQSVENLSQLKTGRLKTLIKSTYHLKSKNTVLKSEEDFKIKAEKINLG